ncbi:hypothetical protein ACJIZ3_016950 [Penstemon smallii]|uniref:ENT domain-containing protein n=1 Tax=Penstemon smallii TaxID=265156 RepID=A0ABD3SVA6_9LAMI
MEAKIHLIEKEAYISVLRAFRSQSDAITWEKESLITELRKELRVSDEEHRELISRVNSDDVVCRIREWRKVKGLQPGMPTLKPSASHKKQKTSTPTCHPLTQSSSSALKRSSVSEARGRKMQSMSPKDKILDAAAPKIPNKGGFKKDVAHGSAVRGPGKGRGFMKAQTVKDFHSSEDGPLKKCSNIELLHTDTLIKEVERVVSQYHPNSAELERAKKVLKEHEQALLEAITMLEDASDGESVHHAVFRRQASNDDFDRFSMYLLPEEFT